LIKRWFASLVNRAVALVVVFVLITAVLMTGIGSAFSRSELERQAFGQVETVARMVARELDQKLALRRDVLATIAADTPASEELLRNRAMVILRQQTALLGLFDATFIIDARGDLLAANPLDFLLPDFDASGRPYFIEVSRTLTPIISAPYVTVLDGQPGVMVAAPLFDRHQRFIGMIGGLILLNGENLMSEFAGVRVGGSGYLRLITRQGIVLVDGNTGGRVMVPVSARRPSVSRAMAGFEGVVHEQSVSGPATIIAYQQMNQVPWFVAAVWPEGDAFAPVNRARDVFVWTLLAVMLVLAPLAFWFFHRLLHPLRNLSVQIYQRHTGERQMPVAETGGREIQNVARVFNFIRDERDEMFRALAEREAFFRTLTQNAPIGIVHSNILGRIEFVNPAMADMLGESAEQITNRYLLSSVAPEDREVVTAGWRQAMTHQGFYRSRLRLLTTRPPGHIWVDAMTSVIELPDQALGTITVAWDVSQEMRFETALQEEQRRADSILDVLHEGVLMIDKDGLIRYANGAGCRFLGLNEDCTGHNFFAAVTISESDQQLEKQEFLAGNEMDNRYVTLKNNSGELYDIDLTMLHLRRGETEERLVFVVRDDSERRREEQRLSWEATHDALTQLMNRRAFTAVLLKAIAEASSLQAPSVLMMIDLDHFKPVNDEGGHLVGDDLLRRIAEELQADVRQSDAVARLGGDEFAILLQGCGLPRAEVLAEQIRKRVEALTIVSDGRSFSVTACIGLTPVSANDSGPREVVARADEGCYIAKFQGRNQVVSVPVPPED